jgi:hypothetical protein
MSANPVVSYCVYRASDGEILRHGKCPRSLIPKQAKAAKGEKAIEQSCDDITDRVVVDQQGTAYVIQRPVAEVNQRRAAVNKAAVPVQQRIVRVLAHLAKQGIDIGADGQALIKEFEGA